MYDYGLTEKERKKDKKNNEEGSKIEAFGVPTPKMDWDSTNLADTWRRFKQHTELMFTGPLKEKNEQEKCSFLLLWIGDKGRDVSNTWTLTEAKLLKTYDKFTDYLTQKPPPYVYEI